MADDATEQPGSAGEELAGPKGVAIHIGLNLVDPQHYGGWDGQLAGCENDANDMLALSTSRGFDASTIITADATASAVSDAIAAAAEALQGGDILFLTYSGHGGQIPDTSADETDQLDETWVLFDRELIDDELSALYATFRPGVRIVVLSDRLPQRHGDPRGALPRDLPPPHRRHRRRRRRHGRPAEDEEPAV